MRAHGLEVFINDDGGIVIDQTRDYGWCGEDAYVVVHPDQLDMLIKWLTEAKEGAG